MTVISSEKKSQMTNTEAEVLKLMQSDRSDARKQSFLYLNSSGGANLDKILQLSRKRRELNQEIREFSQSIKPIEFESYHEYFTIHTFKKGISLSGHVDIEALRRRNNGRFYKRNKRATNTTSTRESASSASNSTLSDEGEYADEEEDKGNDGNQFPIGDNNGTGEGSARTTDKRMTRAQVAARKVTQKNAESQPLEKSEQPDKKLINGDISVTSIITADGSEGHIRRSSRLSQRVNENSGGVNSGDSAGLDTTETGGINIGDLYESLVPKVKEPYRRSDWVLPSRNRYTPEKQMSSKPVFEKVKINELVSSDRIRNVLSKYEGGVAGIRKRG